MTSVAAKVPGALTAASRGAGARSIDDVKIAGRPLEDVLNQETLRFSFDGAAPLTKRPVVPASDAAREHVQTHGNALLDAVRGALGTVDDARYGSILSSVTFATSAEGHAASMTMDWLQAGWPRTARDWQAAKKEAVRNLREARAGGSLASWQVNGGVSLSSETSQHLLSAIAGGGKKRLTADQVDAVATLKHELLHGTGKRGYDPEWVEEGGVEILSRKLTGQTIEAMGLRADRQLVEQDVGSYDDYVDVMRRLAAHSGYELDDGRSFKAYAHEFLRLDQAQFLDHLATRIAQRHSLPKSEIATRLKKLNGNPRTLWRMEQRYGLTGPAEPVKHPRPAPLDRAKRSDLRPTPSR